MAYGWTSIPRDSQLPVERWQDLALVEPEEAGLIRADLVDVNVVVARVVARSDRGKMALRIRPAGDDLGNRLLVDHLDGLFEVAGGRQLHVQVALQRDRRAQAIGRPARFGLVLRPTDVDLEIPWPRSPAGGATSAGGLEAFDDRRIRGEVDQAVADAPRELGGGRTCRGDDDRRRLVRSGVETGVLDREVPAVMVDVLARPQRPDDVDGLLEHFRANIVRWPARAHDVLV